MDQTLADDLQLALSIAKKANEQSMARFRALDLEITTKPDRSPVTDADKSVENIIREQLSKQRPNDSIIGEEFGTSGDSERVWIIDPIDGTANFLRGVPVWATLIGLRVDGEYVLGVVSAPAMHRTWWAAAGHGAFTEDVDSTVREINVSSVKNIADASFSFSSIELWQQSGQIENLLAISEQVWRTRAYGDFWSHMLVAEGVVDISAENDLKIYDWAALAPIVREAGGIFRDQSGELNDETSAVMASNGLLDADLAKLLA